METSISSDDMDILSWHTLFMPLSMTGITKLPSTNYALTVRELLSVKMSCYLTRDCICRWQFGTPHACVWNRDSHDSYCRHGSGKKRDSKRSWLRLKCGSKHVLYSSEQSMNLHSSCHLFRLFWLIFLLIFRRFSFAVHWNSSIYQNVSNCTKMFSFVKDHSLPNIVESVTFVNI